MPSIEESVRTMLTSSTALSGGIPDARITFGYRLQSSVLPAVTFSLQDAVPASLDGERSVDIEVSYIAATALEAAEAEPDVRAAIRSGTFSTNRINAAVFTGSRVDEPITADGDEQQPAVLVCNATLYYELL